MLQQIPHCIFLPRSQGSQAPRGTTWYRRLVNEQMNECSESPETISHTEPLILRRGSRDRLSNCTSYEAPNDLVIIIHPATWSHFPG